jgi:hypothetical protein
MKKMPIYLSRSTLLLVVSLATGWCLTCSVSLSAADKKSPTRPQGTQPAGRLVVVRSATLGPTIVALKIDGVLADQISYNRRYDAPLAAGEHVLTVYPVISIEGARPTQTRLNVEPGRTYTFTAARQDIQIILK